MSKVIIPISVELGNSLQQIKQVNKEFEKLADTASQPLQSALPDAPVKSIKQQLREANVELQNAVANFGKLSPEAQKAAQKVAELKDVIEDSNRAAQAGDIDDAFQVAGRAVAGVSAAFQTATALQGLLGDKSKETEEALKKVQAVMALTQGITGIIEGKKAIEALGASGRKAFLSLVTGIQTATGATKGLSAAIATTGIGLLVVGIGLAVSAIQDYNENLNEAAESTERLAKENERLKNSLDDVIQNSDGYVNRQIKITRNAEKIKDLEVGGEKNIKQINKLRRENLDLAIQADKVELASKEGLLTVNDQLVIKQRIYQNEQAKNRIAIEETENANKKAEENEKERTQKAKQNAEKRARAQESANKILLDLSRRGASDSQQAIFNIQDQYAQKRKQLSEVGIKDFTKLNQAEGEDILKVQQKANQDALNARQNYENALGKIFLDAVKKRKELQDQADEAVKNSRELSQRAELSGIKDDRQKKLQELRNAENKEMDELEKAYEDKKISLEKFLQDQAAIEAFYTNQRAGIKTKEQEDELKRLQDFQSTISDSIAEAADAFGAALAEGADPFQAVFKSLANSLGGYLQQLGKDAIKTSILIQSIKKAIGTPAGIVTGIALVALGAAIKAAFNRKTEKGFARGGYIYGPGTESSDSIPARLSKGEYVVNAKSVRRYGARTMDKINAGQVPVASLIMATERSTGRNGGSATALVNRFEGIEMFSDGGLVESFRQFGRNGGSTTALVNRMETPNIGGDNFQRGQPYIVTTKISGQDLKLVLERADRRFSNAT